MKKILVLLLAITLMLSLAACDIGQILDNTKKPDDTQSAKYDYDPNDLESMLSFIKSAGKTASDETEAEAEALVAKLGDSYETYSKSKASVTSFYGAMQVRASKLYSTFQTCSIDYFKCVAAQGLDDYDTWDDALGDFYDEWDDAMGEYYDVWDDAIGDVYDKLDDLISDASDDMDYSEYSDVWSAMYKEHSDAWSAMYELYSDAWSKTYQDYSACWGGFYEGNTDVDAILADATKEEDQGSENEDETQGNNATTHPNGNSDASGIRPEFKEAMDAYEAFYDEYCDILKQYYDNPTDMTLLTKYTELMTKAIEMDEAFAKWENEDLNNEELKYYLEVNNRVMQKLVDVVD